MTNLIKKTSSLIEKHHKILFYILFFAFILFRIWLVTGIPKLYTYTPHDDLFFARAAHSIIRGAWMGNYDQYTLIKGPFYAFFLIISFLSGLPLFLTETLFFVGACVVLFIALKPLIPNPWYRFIVFSFALFTPNSMAIFINLRVYREFVYYSLSLYVIAFAIGLLLQINNKPKYMIIWSLGLGLSMSAFLLTREEGIWIYPILGIFFVIALTRIWRMKRNKPILKSVIMLLPTLVWFVPILLVSYLNYTHYGFWGVSEQLEPEFNRVLNTLARIETGETWHPAIQISKSARLAAYEASPTLSKLAHTVEQSIKGWNEYDNNAMMHKPDWYLTRYGDAGSELGNGHFPWLFRDAVYQKGYYRDGNYPKELFLQIGNELENACNSGELACKEENHLPAIVGAIDKRHIPIITRMFWENLLHIIQINYSTIHSLDVNQDWPEWPVDDNEYAVFEQFSYNPVDTIDTIENDELPSNIYGVIDLRYRAIVIKENYMRAITQFFKLIFIALFLIALVNWGVLIFITVFQRNESKQFDFAVISSFVLFAFLGRLATLTIVDATTSIPGRLYGQSTQIFLVVFVMVMFVWGIKYLQQKSAFSNRKEPVSEETSF
jgi:hypothetical protein